MPDALGDLLRARDPRFFSSLRARVLAASGFEELVSLVTMKRRALARGLAPEAQASMKLALTGGVTLRPLADLIALAAWARGVDLSLFVGEFDQCARELLEPRSALASFKPDVIAVFPGPSAARFTSSPTDSLEAQRADVLRARDELLVLVESAHATTRAEILLATFAVPPSFDLGSYRARTLACATTFTKALNLELGLALPPHAEVVDVELLASRRGALASRDDRGWFESKQLGSPELLADVAREVAHLVAERRSAPKKVLVLDLDNTLWGGVVGEDGLAGLELGATSARGEAFLAFQRAVLRLRARGVLLAVCSKNDPKLARETIDGHPEMLIRTRDLAAIVASWAPKSEGLRAIAAELGLGLDALVLADDNPAEIDEVRLRAPEVATILLDGDPAEHARHLEDSRFFEARAITADDAARPERVRADAAREGLKQRARDFTSYLASLDMKATVAEMRRADAPRVAQLLGKTNQWNLTTTRRTEAEVLALAGDLRWALVTLRLSDRFGDHGLVGVLFAVQEGARLVVDTLLLSCRVLGRGVESELFRELVAIAELRGCSTIEGRYRPTPRNALVADLYPSRGFSRAREDADGTVVFEARVADVAIEERAGKSLWRSDESSSSFDANAAGL